MRLMSYHLKSVRELTRCYMSTYINTIIGALIVKGGSSVSSIDLDQVNIHKKLDKTVGEAATQLR